MSARREMTADRLSQLFRHAFVHLLTGIVKTARQQLEPQGLGAPEAGVRAAQAGAPTAPIATTLSDMVGVISFSMLSAAGSAPATDSRSGNSPPGVSQLVTIQIRVTNGSSNLRRAIFVGPRARK